MRKGRPPYLLIAGICFGFTAIAFFVFDHHLKKAMREDVDRRAHLSNEDASLRIIAAALWYYWQAGREPRPLTVERLRAGGYSLDLAGAIDFYVEEMKVRRETFYPNSPRAPAFDLILDLPPDAAWGTPIALTAGLKSDGTWVQKERPTSDSTGGYLARVPFEVTYFAELKNRNDGLTHYTTGEPTANLAEALPPGGIVMRADGNYIVRDAQLLPWEPTVP